MQTTFPSRFSLSFRLLLSSGVSGVGIIGVIFFILFSLFTKLLFFGRTWFKVCNRWFSHLLSSLVRVDSWHLERMEAKRIFFHFFWCHHFISDPCDATSVAGILLVQGRYFMSVSVFQMPAVLTDKVIIFLLKNWQKSAFQVRHLVCFWSVPGCQFRPLLNCFCVLLLTPPPTGNGHSRNAVAQRRWTTRPATGPQGWGRVGCLPGNKTKPTHKYTNTYTDKQTNTQTDTHTQSQTQTHEFYITITLHCHCTAAGNGTAIPFVLHINTLRH